MKPKALWASLVATLVVVAALLTVNLSMGNTPVLGLDLQGGVSVILAPTEPADGDDLLVVRDLIRDELERLGIAEPDVRVEASNLVVDLPGVRDQQQAVEAVDVAGIVTLRPVMQCFTQMPEPIDPEPGTTEPGTTEPETTGPGTTAPDTTEPETTEPTDDDDVAPTGLRRSAPEPTDPEPTDPESTDPELDLDDLDLDGLDLDQLDLDDLDLDELDGLDLDELLGGGVPGDPAAPGAEDILPLRDTDEACMVGFVGGTGEVFSRGSAQPTLDPTQGWGVAVDLRGEGEIEWNLLASQCFQRSASCPSGQLAIVLDDVIQSAPTVNAPQFAGSVSITGNFTESEARGLARVLNRGAFPVDVETLSVETVSPALGSDTLRAAIISGLVGAAAIMILMALYYRRMAVVAIAGLIVWATAMYSATVFVSQATNYALSLAGATGIIVAIGIAVDSYVVMFERLKDEFRSGRSPRNAAGRSFDKSLKTIMSANIVSLLGSGILFALSVGSVRGFALYLGLTTVCNLIVYILFARPAIVLLSRTGWLDDRNRRREAEIGAPA